MGMTWDLKFDEGTFINFHVVSTRVRYNTVKASDGRLEPL